MAVTHFMFKGDRIGEDDFLKFNSLYNSFIKGHEKEFHTFLLSPCYNKNKKLPYLFNEFTSIANKGKDDYLSGDKILSYWNKTKTCSEDLRLFVLVKNLNKISNLILKFIVYQKTTEKDTAFYRILHQALLNKEQEKLRKSCCKKLRNIIQNQPASFGAFADDFLIDYTNYYLSRTDREQDGLVLISELQQKFNYLSEGINAKLACEKINLEMLAKQQSKEPLIDNILPAPKSDLTRLYQLNKAIHQAPNGFSFFRFNVFEKYFFSVHKFIDPHERHILCKYTINALNRAVKGGAFRLNTEIFKWIKHRIEWKPTDIKEETINDYLNTINIACWNQDFQFAETYLEEYAPCLPTKYNIITYQLGLADILFWKKEYTAAFNILKRELEAQEGTGQKSKKQIDTHYVFMLRIKILLLRIGAEVQLQLDLEIDDETEDEIYNYYNKTMNSLRVYLNRRYENNSISPYYFQSHIGFHNYLKEIISIKKNCTDDNKCCEKGSELQYQLRQEKNITACEWLNGLIQKHLLIS